MTQTRYNPQPLSSPDAFKERIIVLFSSNPSDQICVIGDKSFDNFIKLAQQEIRQARAVETYIRTGGELLAFAERIFDAAIDDPDFTNPVAEHVLQHIGARLGQVAGTLLDNCPTQENIRREAFERWTRKRLLTTTPMGVLALGSIFSISGMM
ncbi:MAG TPA: hypothetical protein VLG12_03830 [Candidatus Saccharimonadales bacterium]|nr:hypothetical protein [Candidatus Saccharimonadales bacterium]